jgi:hypothetical protein
MSASSMRAVQVVKAGGAFVLTNLPVPDPGPAFLITYLNQRLRYMP